MAASLPLFFDLQFFTNDGAMAANHLLYTFDNGTNNPKATYADAAGTVPNANPLTLNAAGRCTIWLAAGSYSFELRTPSDVLVKRYDGIDSAASAASAIAADLANSTDAAKGPGMVAYSVLRDYAEGTTGAKLRERVSVKDFGATGDGVTDDYAAIQAALDYLYAAGGGTCWFPEADAYYLCNTPLIAKYGVNLKGAGSKRSIIQKDTNASLSPANSVSSLAGGYPTGTLPANINAILMLDGPTSDHRYVGSIEGLTFRGALATPGNYESQIVEFGIVSLGSVSDYRRIDCEIVQVQYGEIYPIIFVSQLKRTRISNCLHGIFINNGTSTAIEANYVNGARDYGYYIRDLKYSEVSSNACDELNNPTDFPTRTRTCSAYVFRSVLGLTVTNNGDEGTYGRSLEFNEFDHSVCEGHLTARVGSDYIGADEIAWIYSTSTMRGSRVVNNLAYNVKPSGLISGGANAAKHHNFYFEGLTVVQGVDFYNNIVRAARTGAIAEAGWGNNVPSTWINGARGESLVYTHTPTFTAQVPGDIAVVFGADNRHYIEQRGTLLHVWGCFHVTPTYTTATGLVIIDAFPTNGSRSAGFDVIGVGGGSALPQRLGWFEMSAGATGAVSRTDDDTNFTIAGIPSGTAVKIHYDGWYSIV